LEKRPPPRLHKVPTQNNEVSLQTFQTALVLRGLCDTTVPNVHTLTADKSDDIKDSSYKELEHVSVQFPKYHMKILLQDFNTKVGREYILKPRIGNESSREISNGNGIRVVNSAT